VGFYDKAYDEEGRQGPWDYAQSFEKIPDDKHVLQSVGKYKNWQTKRASDSPNLLHCTPCQYKFLWKFTGEQTEVALNPAQEPLDLMRRKKFNIS